MHEAVRHTESGFLSSLSSMASLDYSNRNHPHLIMPTEPARFINRQMVNAYLDAYHGTAHSNRSTRNSRQESVNRAYRNMLRQGGASEQLVNQLATPIDKCYELAWLWFLWQKYGNEFILDYNALGNPFPADYEMMRYNTRGQGAQTANPANPDSALPNTETNTLPSQGNSGLPAWGSGDLPDHATTAGANIPIPIMLGLGAVVVGGAAIALAKSSKKKK
jgi:hypothetical protein